MAKNKCPQCPPEGLAQWLGTYSDTMTLLLCFFILMFNVSEIDSTLR